MQRLLIVLGVLLVLAGLAWPWISRLPWGRLPGDLSASEPGALALVAECAGKPLA
ncbi:DUF2905 family protein [Tepidimonas sp. HKU77]|uniref:DUF2905 family protein n=1 Tax=unclassified Tepidimonas TaxID=2631705 RepID=UPI003C7C7961